MKKLLFAGLIAGLFLACNKNIDLTTVVDPGPIPTVNVQSSLYGRVFDEYGYPFPGATVQVAGQTLTTNAQGLFFLHDKQLDKNGTYVRVSAPGYFTTARFAYPQLGSSTYLEITLLGSGFFHNFSTTAIAELALNGGASVTIPAGNLVTAGGQAYTGIFKVAARWLDPSDPATFRQMPGDLRAQNADGQAKVLKTFGMIGVEISSPSGDPLQLAPGKKATIGLPIPASIQASAPSSIPLWHFDDATGYWLEDGSATRKGNNYVGEVSHFSFWNCDVPADYIILDGCLGDLTGQPLANVAISLTSAQFGTGSGYTDAQGLFGGVVPANEELILKVWDDCNSVVYETTIGPFATNTTLSKIKVNPGSQELITVSGDLLDCNNLPLSTGLAYVYDLDTLLTILPTDANGHFEGSFYQCYSLTTLSIIAYDAADPLQSTPVAVNIMGNVANAGTIPVCNSLDQYITFDINGISRTYYQQTGFNVQGSFYANETLDSNYIQLIFYNYSAVTNQADIGYLSGVYRIGNVLQNFGCDYCTLGVCNCYASDTGPLQFSHYPQFIGDYATGTASGSVFQGTGLVPYTLNFRLKRTQ